MTTKANISARSRYEDLEAAAEAMNALSQSSTNSTNNSKRASLSEAATTSESPGVSNEDVASGIVSPKRARRETTAPTRKEAIPMSKMQKQKAAAPTVKHCHSWETMYEHLVLYYREHGHSLVPRSYETPLNESLVQDDSKRTGIIKLGKWVDKQRQRKNVISADRKEKLNNLDFVWVVQVPWDEMYKRLVKFKSEHGHCLVPQKYDADPKLGVWVSNQRTIKKQRGKLIDGRVDKLNAIGFTWWPPKQRHKRHKIPMGAIDDVNSTTTSSINNSGSISSMKPSTLAASQDGKKADIAYLRSLYSKKQAAKDIGNSSQPFYSGVNGPSQFFIPEAEKTKLLAASLEKAQQTLGFLDKTCCDDDDDDNMFIQQQHQAQQQAAMMNVMPAVTPYFGMFSSGCFAAPNALSASATTNIKPQGTIASSVAATARRGSINNAAAAAASFINNNPAAAVAAYDGNFYETMVAGAAAYGNNDDDQEEEYDEEMILKFLRETKDEDRAAVDAWGHGVHGISGNTGNSGSSLLGADSGHVRGDFGGIDSSQNIDDLNTRMKIHWG